MESRAVGRVCLGGRVAHTGWEEGGGRARRPEGVKGREERGRNQSSVPPAVPQGGRRADVMSEFGHLSSRKYTHTHTHKHTHTQWGALTPLMAVPPSHSVQRREWFYMDVLQTPTLLCWSPGERDRIGHCHISGLPEEGWGRGGGGSGQMACRCCDPSLGLQPSIAAPDLLHFHWKRFTWLQSWQRTNRTSHGPWHRHRTKRCDECDHVSAARRGAPSLLHGPR